MNTKKTLVAVIAAMLVAATLPCFAKGNVVTQWKCIAPDGSGTVFFTFYSDKTCEMVAIDKDGDVADQVELTYSGDSTKNGKISIEGPYGAFIVEIVGNALEMKVDDTSAVFVKVKK